MDSAPEAIRRGRKYDQVLAGARTVFLRDGFEGASVDDIAREAGVSKATLYSYFPDKRLLFMAFARAECTRQAEEGAAAVDMNRPPAEVLTDAAQRMVAFLLSDFGMRVFRICVAESDRFPALGHEFYHSGPEMVRRKLAHYLDLAVARGELAIDDVMLAADQFHALCKGGLLDRALFGIADSGAPGDIDRTVEGAVAMFLARYGVSS